MHRPSHASLPMLLGLIGLALAPLATVPAATGAEVAVPRIVRLVVPYPPGGSTDIIARQMANGLGKRLGNSVIVENKPGGGSVVGSAFVAKAPPDGATLLLTTSALTITAAIQEKLTYDPLVDLVPLGMLTEVPLVVAVPTGSPYKSIAELIADARARPGAINYGTSGIGSSNHLASEMLNTAAKIRTTHVPYKGMGQATVDLASGQVQMIIGSYSSLAAVLQGGKARALALTALEPSPRHPGLPTVAAAVPGFKATVWFGMFAPRGTPPALVTLMAGEIRAIVNSDDFAAFFVNERAEASKLDLAAVSTLLASEVRNFRQIAREQNIKAE